MERNQKIIRISIQGIVVNIILVIFKMAVGAVSHSIAIILDAVNNLSDALSSVITIAGTKIASRAPDKQHPFGYGRSEYISSVAISLIILFAGVSALKESLEKAVHPESTQYTAATIVIIAAAVIVKFAFGQYLKRAGNAINAQSLVASGTDAVLDAFVSLGTLAAAFAGMLWNVNIDGIIGAVISVFILKAGFDVLKETLGSIIGARVDSQFALKIKRQINTHGEVRGSYDLVLHDYGPNEMIGSVHIEVADEMTAKEIDVLTREIMADIYGRFGVLLTIGIYASNTTDSSNLEIKKAIENEIRKYPEVIQMHGFYVDTDKKAVSFDLVMDYNAENPDQTIGEIKNTLAQRYPEHTFFVYKDSDYSD